MEIFEMGIFVLDEMKEIFPDEYDSIINGLP